MTKEDDIRSLITLNKTLKSVRSQHESDWRDCIELFMPARWDETSDYIPEAAELADSHGRYLAETMASGLVSLLFPREEQFFAYGQPVGQKKADHVIRWLRLKTDDIRSMLHASNFFEEIQVSLRELVVLGTCCVYIDQVRDGRFSFKNQPAFSYVIGENSRGRVDTVIRQLSYTPNQAADEWGKENLPKKIADEVGTNYGMTRFHSFLHIAMPNRLTEKEKKGLPAKKRKAFRNVVIAEREKHMVVDDGYDSLPFVVCRYAKVGNSVWGVGAATMVKGDAFQCESLNQAADVGTEKMIFPSLIAPSSAYGNIQSGPGSVTYYDDKDPNGKLANQFREWGSDNIRLEVPLRRIEDKHAAMERAFFLQMFLQFSQRAQTNREITATEAMLASKESLSQFAPVGSRIQTEMMDPMFSRLFAVAYAEPGLLWNAAEDDLPPDELLVRQGKDTRTLLPSVSYKNKISLQLGLKENGTLTDTINGLQVVVQLAPEVMDCFELDTIAVDYARNAGMGESWIRKPDDKLKIRKGRAEAQAQAEQMAQLQQGAAAAKDINQAQK